MQMNTENENIMQSMGNRNLDEMRQQTLDALKVVQSFEVKPARSAQVKELLAQKTQTRRQGPASSSTKQSSVLGPGTKPSAAAPPRHVLQPVLESASPEKRFASSPKKIPSATASPGRSPLHDKTSRTREASPVKSLFTKRLKQEPTSTAAEQSLGHIRPVVVRNSAAYAKRPSQSQVTALPSRSLAGPDSSLVRASTQGAHQSSRRGPFVSSFRSVSRLLQPTAASAAKMRPGRAPMASGRTVQVDQSSRADNSMITRPSATALSTRPSAFATKPLASSGSALFKPTMPSLSSKHPPRMGGVSQLNVAQNSPLAFSQAGSSAPKVNRVMPVGSSTNTGVTATAAVPSLQPPKSLLSSVLSKTHNDKQPAEHVKLAQKSVLQTPNAPESSTAQSASCRPLLLGITDAPAVTSTPVRPTPNSSVSEHSSGSFHSFDFTNFSFEASWVKTPELRKKVLEQKNDDTMQLFGHMPPINLESIFGAEMKRQRR